MISSLPALIDLGTLVFVSAADTSSVVPQPPPEDGFARASDGFDWVLLTSGEWLRGALIAIADDDIEFDSDVLGVLEIGLQDVRRLYGHRPYGVKVRDRGLLTGDLRVVGDEVVIRSDETEADRWSGDISLGLNLRRGNSEVVEFDMIVGAERRTHGSRGGLNYVGSYNQTDGLEVANNHRLTGALDIFGDSRLFWRPIIVGYFRDPFQNIEHQATLETGVGYKFVRNSRTTWDAFAGIGVNISRGDLDETGARETDTSPALTLGTNLETEVTRWMDYIVDFQMTFLDEGSGSYQHHLLTTPSSDLIGDIDLDVSIVWDRTQDPRPGSDGDGEHHDAVGLLILRTTKTCQETTPEDARGSRMDVFTRNISVGTDSVSYRIGPSPTKRLRDVRNVAQVERVNG